MSLSNSENCASFFSPTLRGIGYVCFQAPKRIDSARPVGLEFIVLCGSFGRQGPAQQPPPPAFSPNRVARDVTRLVNREFPKHPCALDDFDWPVTPRPCDGVFPS